MDFWVVKLAGKQILVSPDKPFCVEANLGKVGDRIVINEVLLTSIADKITVGTPLVSGAKVTAEIIFSGRGEKIRVSKFKAKSRYRKVVGFHPDVTTFKIVGAKEDEKVSTSVRKQPASRPGGAKKPVKRAKKS